MWKTPGRSASASAAAWLVVVAGIGAARAAECPPIAGGVAALGQIDAAERLQFVRTSLDDGARRARLWTWVWGPAQAGLAVGQLTAALIIDDQGRQKDLYVGAARSGVALLSIVALPMKALSGPPPPGRSDLAAGADERCADLARAEERLLRGAADESGARLWLLHAGNVIVNTSAALILAYGFDRGTQGLVSGLAGFAVGEVMILTRPTDLPGALRRYRAADIGPASRARVWQLAPLLTHNAAGIMVATAF